MDCTITGFVRPCHFPVRTFREVLQATPAKWLIMPLPRCAPPTSFPFTASLIQPSVLALSADADIAFPPLSFHARTSARASLDFSALSGDSALCLLFCLLLSLAALWIVHLFCACARSALCTVLVVLTRAGFQMVGLTV